LYCIILDILDILYYIILDILYIKMPIDICKYSNTISIVGISVAIFATFTGILYKVIANQDDYVIPEDDEELSIKRQESRGMTTSLIVALVFGTFSTLINTVSKVHLPTSTALLSLFLGNTVGFLMDNAMGTNEGLRKFQKDGFTSGIKNMFSSLASGKYLRYIVTVLLDVFVALLMLHTTYNAMIQLPYFGCNNLTKSVANGIVASVIGIITFNAFTNQTRFLWAYPDPSLGIKNTLPSFTILMSTIIMALIFLRADTGNEGIDNRKIKIIMVYAVLGIITVLYMSGMDAPKMIDDVNESNSKLNNTNNTETDIENGSKSINETEHETETIKNTYISGTIESKIMNVPAHVISSINNLIVEDHYKGKIIFMILTIITVLGTFATSKMKPVNKWGIPVLIIVIFGVITFTDCFGVFIDMVNSDSSR
jgi:hypothetical protein